MFRGFEVWEGPAALNEKDMDDPIPSSWPKDLFHPGAVEPVLTA
jgi:hypothetical protein